MVRSGLMASDGDPRSVTNTLTGTTADTVTIEQAWPALQITNHDASDTLYFRYDGVTAVAAADGAEPVLPGTSVVIAVSPNAAGQHVISIVGDGGGYTIAGVN